MMNAKKLENNSNSSKITINNNLNADEDIEKQKFEQLIYDELLYKHNTSLLSIKYTYNIIAKYLNEYEIKEGVEIKNKIRRRNLRYLGKLFKNKNQVSKYNKKHDITYAKILLRFFISFNKNISILLSKHKKSKIEISDKIIMHLNHIMKILLNIIGILYISENINDDNFEFLMKIMLELSLENIPQKNDDKIEELNYMMFFKETIHFIKIVFNKIYFLQKDIPERKKELIKNIIIHINNNIIGSFEKKNFNYSNKYYLSKYDYKTSLLIDLSYIINKINSDEITNHFLNLLSNIYSFEFGYINGIKPTITLIEPIFLNTNNKTIDEIKNDLDLTDFSLKYLNALIKQEKKILGIDSCLIKSGLYFGKGQTGLYSDINNLDNDFLIIFGFRLDLEDTYDIPLFGIYQEEKLQIRCYIDISMGNKYQLQIEDEKTVHTPNIYIQNKKTYIFMFQFMLKKLKCLKIKYIKDDENEKNEQLKAKINMGKTLKIKSIKQDNLKIYIGCNRENNIDSNFIGFMGNFIILNSNKYIKEDKDKDLYDEILHLKYNYTDIIKLLSSNKNSLIQNDNYYNMENNSTFNTTKKALEKLENRTELINNYSINTIISLKYFKLVEYHDDIDYLDSFNNFEYYLKEGQKPLTIKNKYIISKGKSDSNHKKNFTINTSIFNKYFHFFERKFSLIEFIKYEGIHYLSLLLEYYFQILCHISEKIDDGDFNDKNNLDSIYGEINTKIISVLNFFNLNIIKTHLYENNINETKQFFNQMVLLIFKFVEKKGLHEKSFKTISDILYSFEENIKSEKKKPDVEEFLLLIRRKIFELLINPRIYKEIMIEKEKEMNKEKENENEQDKENLEDDKRNIIEKENEKEIESNCLQNLNYTFLSLLTFLKNSKIINLENILLKKNFQILLSYIWLLGKPKKMKLFETTKNNFISLVVLFLQLSSANILEKKIIKNSKSSNQIEDESEKSISSKKSLNKSRNGSKEANNNENIFMPYIYQKALEYRNNEYIFYQLTLIIVKTNLIYLLDESEITKAKDYFLCETRIFDINNSDNKKLIYFSYLLILVSYYFSETKSEQDNLHDFIRKELYLDKDLFYSLISLIRQVTNISKTTKRDIKSFEKEDIRTFNNNDEPTFSDLPIKDLKINSLNEKDVYIIKNIFLDILYLLKKLVKKCAKKEKEIHSTKNINDTPSSFQSSEENIEKFYEVLKINIDYIFNHPRTSLYEAIFSSESKICSKLLKIKWKYGNENDIKYIIKVMKKYYKELVKNSFCPFVFQFLLNNSSKNILKKESKHHNKEAIELNFKAEIFTHIISCLRELSKELKTSKNKYISYYVYNMVNFLIVINNELNYKPNKLFINKELCDNFGVLIFLTSKGLLFSNYCIEMNNKQGKIISEIIFDLFFAIPEEYFNRDLFLNTFRKKGKDINYTIFYIIDRNKERLITRKKAQNAINLPELETLKEYNNIFASNKGKKANLPENCKLFPNKEANYTMYFLAKSFVYLKSNFIKDIEKQLKIIIRDRSKEKIKEMVLQKIINDLSINLYCLYTKNNMFYETKNCGFPLYDETKRYFESYIIQNYNARKPEKNTELYKKFFEYDLMVILKNEYELEYCYSSRLCLGMRNKLFKPETDEKENNPERNKISSNKSINSSDNSSANNKSNKSLLIYPENLKDHQDRYNSENKSDYSDENKINIEKNTKKEIKIEEREFNHSFELIKEKYMMLNPRNFFFKRIFSDIFKDILFKNKPFLNIKKIYIIKYYRRIGFTIESKQLDYPSRQKNYSNFLEPRIFLRRDYNYFDKIFFPISFCYLPDTFKNQEYEEMIFYKHKYKMKKEKIIFSIECELVSSQNISFGNFIFFEKFIIFEKKTDPRDKNPKELNVFQNYSISTKNIEKKLIKKDKFLVIFFNDIKEAIKRRSLLITQSIEIYLKNGKSYFFNFFKEAKAKPIYERFNEKKSQFNFTFDIDYNQKEIKNISSKFHEGKLSSYLYILYLNKYATRTYNDLSQYPVFPWLVLDHNKVDNIYEYFENKTNVNNVTEPDLRDMKYPISMQSESKRKDAITKYEDEKEYHNFLSHFNTHYSNSAFIFYYLMRLNPYCQGMIKLQNYNNENPNRMFLSFESLQVILQIGVDNRELIPDFFCYFDYFINLNCNYFGSIIDESINDDFSVNGEKLPKNENLISSFVKNLYKDKRLLNSNFISRRIPDWVDIIFGKNQLPEDEEDAAKSCNIFNKLSYEQKVNFEKKIEKLKKKLGDKSITEKNFVEKMRGKLDLAINFGMTPKQILKSTITFEEENKHVIIIELNKVFEDKLIYYEKLPNGEYLFLKDTVKKDKGKVRNVGIYTFKNKNLSELKIYKFEQLNLIKKFKNIKIYSKGKKIKIPLYHPSYSISYLELKNIKSKNKNDNIAILSCRYIENYFTIQTSEKNINVLCEDFVTCVKTNNIVDINIFYTGLLNGKLIEWEIDSNFNVNEIKHIYSHQDSITAIELYNHQSIIITASKDKYIHIRKQFDFELLTAINLTYCFANPIVSQRLNIIPSIIKISDLNLLYVLIYDLDSKSNFIRGYNLNGLFFAQTEDDFFVEGNNRILINNISFTKNYNLNIGFYNCNKYFSLNSWDLKPNCFLRDLDFSKEKKERFGTKMIEYDSYSEMFNLLYENEFIIKATKEND